MKLMFTFNSRLSREEWCLLPRILGLTIVKPPALNNRRGLESSGSLGGVGTGCICVAIPDSAEGL